MEGNKQNSHPQKEQKNMVTINTKEDANNERK